MGKLNKEQIAEQYDNAVSDMTLAPYWEKLAKESEELADSLRKLYKVTIVDQAEPYHTAADMFADLDKRIFKVSGVNCEHPIFTREQNIDWRISHDILGHYRAKAGFSWRGEVASFEAQADWYSADAVVALKCEILGQTASRSVNGTFPEQKLVRLA